MEYKEFEKEIIENGKKIGLDIAEKESKNLYKYMLLMLEWNENVNLTAITEEKEIIYKHFIDSLSVNKYLTNKEKIMDIGTGAGFPGIPLKIFNEDLNFILVDSLNKRINFLEEVKNELNLNKLELVHARAEELAKNKNYRKHGYCCIKSCC